MKFIARLCLIFAIAAPLAHADLLTGLYDTGVDSNGNPIAGDNNSTYTDSHYTVTSSPNGTDTASIGNLAPGSWIGADASSQWIYPTDNGDEAGAIDYETTFDITGAFSSAEITGQFSTDNEMEDIVLNGHDLGIQQLDANDWSTWTTFSITDSAYFVQGVNTLVFETNNDSGPGGVRVEMTGSATPAVSGVPDSTPTLWLLVAALLAMAGWTVGQPRRDALLCRSEC